MGDEKTGNFGYYNLVSTEISTIDNLHKQVELRTCNDMWKISSYNSVN